MRWDLSLLCLFPHHVDDTEIKTSENIFVMFRARAHPFSYNWQKRTMEFTGSEIRNQNAGSWYRLQNYF